MGNKYERDLGSYSALCPWIFGMRIPNPKVKGFMYRKKIHDVMSISLFLYVFYCVDLVMLYNRM